MVNAIRALNNTQVLTVFATLALLEPAAKPSYVDRITNASTVVHVILDRLKLTAAVVMDLLVRTAS